MPLPVFDNQAAVPEADRADFVEYKGKWHQKDWVAATTEAERVKGINASLIGEKSTAEQQAAAEKKRADDLEAAQKTGKTQQELDAYVAPVQKKLEAAEATQKDLQAKLDRRDLEHLVRKHTKDAGLLGERLDDPDNMDILLRNVAMVNGNAVVNDKDGKATATPLVDHLKSFKATKKWLFAYEGGSGGGAEHGDPATGDGVRTVEKDLKSINDQRAAGHNPLMPPKAAAK